MRRDKISKLKNQNCFLVKYRDKIFHWVVIISLTIYIVMNWKDCISMQLFSDFDGNNILFVVWIVLIFLMLYDVEAKDIKLKKHELKEDLVNADMMYNINLMSHSINQSSALNENQKVGTDKGGSSD